MGWLFWFVQRGSGDRRDLTTSVERRRVGTLVLVLVVACGGADRNGWWDVGAAVVEDVGVFAVVAAAVGAGVLVSALGVQVAWRMLAALMLRLLAMSALLISTQRAVETGLTAPFELLLSAASVSASGWSSRLPRARESSEPSSFRGSGSCCCCVPRHCCCQHAGLVGCR